MYKAISIVMFIVLYLVVLLVYIYSIYGGEMSKLHSRTSSVYSVYQNMLVFKSVIYVHFSIHLCCYTVSV